MKTYPIPCTKEEMDKLILVSLKDDFYYTLFMVAKTTGRRLGELYNIKVEDINFEKGIMYTIILKRKKYVKKEAILSEEVGRLLQSYIMRSNLKEGDYVFRRVSYRAIQYAVTRYAQQAKIRHPVSFHNFRHYFVTELVRQGWSYDKIAKLTGHSSIYSLAEYDSAVPSDIMEEALLALRKL